MASWKEQVEAFKTATPSRETVLLRLLRAKVGSLPPDELLLDRLKLCGYESVDNLTDDLLVDRAASLLEQPYDIEEAFVTLSTHRSLRKFACSRELSDPQSAGATDAAIPTPANDSPIALPPNAVIHRVAGHASLGRDIPKDSFDIATLMVNAFCCGKPGVCGGNCQCRAGVSVMLKSAAASAEEFYQAHLQLIKLLASKEILNCAVLTGKAKDHVRKSLDTLGLEQLRLSLQSVSVDLPCCFVHNGEVPGFRVFFDAPANPADAQLRHHGLLQPLNSISLGLYNSVATCQHPQGSWLPCPVLLRAAAEVKNLLASEPPDELIDKLAVTWDQPKEAAGYEVCVAAETLQEYAAYLVEEDSSPRPPAWGEDLFDTVMYIGLLADVTEPLASPFPVRLATLLLAAIRVSCGPYYHRTYDYMVSAVARALNLSFDQVLRDNVEDRMPPPPPPPPPVAANFVLLHGAAIPCYTDDVVEEEEEPVSIPVEGNDLDELRTFLVTILQLSQSDRESVIEKYGDKPENALMFAHYLDKSSSPDSARELSELLDRSSQWAATAASVTLLIGGLSTQDTTRVCELLNLDSSLGNDLMRLASCFLRALAWEKHHTEVPLLATRLLFCETTMLPPGNFTTVRPPSIHDDVYVAMFTTERSDIGLKVGTSLARSISHALDHLRSDVWRVPESFMVAFVSDTATWRIPSTLLRANSPLAEDEAIGWAKGVSRSLEPYCKKFGIVSDGDTFQCTNRTLKVLMLFTWSLDLFNRAVPAISQIVRRSEVTTIHHELSLHMLNLQDHNRFLTTPLSPAS